MIKIKLKWRKLLTKIYYKVFIMLYENNTSHLINLLLNKKYKKLNHLKNKK